jgi:hypothetical protein
MSVQDAGMVSWTGGESKLVSVQGRVPADAGVVGSWIGGDASEEGMVRLFAENNGEMFIAYSRVITCQCSKSDGQTRLDIKIETLG